MQNNFHTDFDSSVEEPYRSLQILGFGGAGRVDKVEQVGREGKCFARKLFILRDKRNERVEEIRKEARILSRLQHQHIVKVLGTYCWKNHFGILIQPIAEGDLADLLARADTMEPGLNWKPLLLRWPMCLLRAVDFIHEMRVKHRDIKPSNILIVDGFTILLTDFGIARDVAMDNTTGSYEAVGPFTPMYSSPEFFEEGARRGRASDIFSLGCVFLEICTALVAPSESLKRFSDFRYKRAGSRAYARDPITILHWIWHLWGHWSDRVKPNQQSEFFAQHGVALADLAFLMMDPDASTRITARQLIALTSTDRCYYYSSVNQRSCLDCRSARSFEDRNIPLHSIFYHTDELEYPTTPEEALEASPASSWEDAKRKWLKEHIWW